MIPHDTRILPPFRTEYNNPKVFTTCQISCTSDIRYGSKVILEQNLCIQNQIAQVVTQRDLCAATRAIWFRSLDSLNQKSLA